MKTYILNGLDRLKQYSKQLDAKAVLFDKNWEVFNEKGDKELLVFRPNNELLIVRKGIVQKSKWELLSTSSIIIETVDTSYFFNAAFVDNNFLALQLDGTNECMLMVESETKKQLALDTISNVEKYLEQKHKTIPKDEETIIQDTPQETSIFDINFFIVVSVTIILFAIVLIITFKNS